MGIWFGNLAEVDLATYRPGRVTPILRQLGFGLLCTAGFICVRMLFDQYAPTAGPFALIYPAVLIATLFGRWVSGITCYSATLAWTWLFILPQAEFLRLARPSDVPRTLINAMSILVVLVFAELFRAAVRRAVSERDLALREMCEREDELRELNQTLETRVATRSEQLRATEESLRQSQKMEAIGQLTGGVAHDFNNLLTVIKGSVELLKRADLGDPRQVRYVDAIGDTADRAAKLTSQLLSFARRQALKPEVFDVGASAGDVGGIVRSLVGSRIVLDVRTPGEPLYVDADRSQFDTAIVNLVVNARDAMKGEGSLRIQVEAVSGIPAVRAHTPVSGDFVAVTVSDTGTGIASDQIDRIFEPFFTTKAVGEGTGLGLSQVFGFAKQSQGDVRVESGAGEGAAFTLYLPRVAAEGLPAVSSASPAQKVDGEGICVLIVEDNPDVAEFAKAALRELGYGTISVSNAADALDHLGRTPGRFHVVFSDVVMPGMSGIELARRMSELYPDVPVVLTSGYSDVLAVDAQHGFPLLQKPYSVEQLSRVLRGTIPR